MSNNIGTYPQTSCQYLLIFYTLSPTLVKATLKNSSLQLTCMLFWPSIALRTKAHCIVQMLEVKTQMSEANKDIMEAQAEKMKPATKGGLWFHPSW
jgi:hypothetical protein